MLKEYHYDHLIHWPRGERAAVFLTFDFQGGEDVKPDKNGILNYEMWANTARTMPFIGCCGF
jgi:peptidoglycan-N-acetylglucosamine deacetylase